MSDFRPYGRTFERVLLERSGRIARLTLNDPSRINALTHGPGSMEDELIQALDIIDREDELHCTIVSGAGGNFSSGGDIGAGHPGGGISDFLTFLQVASAANDRIREFRKPTIAAVDGICYGAGLILAMQMDLLVATTEARFGMIETRFGGCGVETLPFLVGGQWAKFLALSGEVITAAKAKEIGLILEVFGRDQFDRKVYDLANRIAAMPRDGAMLNRRLLNSIQDLMGRSRAQRELADAINAIIMSLHRGARAADGRLLFEVLDREGWRAFKQARDKEFSTPWLEDC